VGSEEIFPSFRSPQTYVIVDRWEVELFRISAASSLGEFGKLPSVKGSQRYGKEEDTSKEHSFVFKLLSHSITIVPYLLCVLFYFYFFSQKTVQGRFAGTASHIQGLESVEEGVGRTSYSRGKSKEEEQQR